MKATSFEAFFVSGIQGTLLRYDVNNTLGRNYSIFI